MGFHEKPDCIFFVCLSLKFFLFPLVAHQVKSDLHILFCMGKIHAQPAVVSMLGVCCTQAAPLRQGKPALSPYPTIKKDIIMQIPWYIDLCLGHTLK